MKLRATALLVGLLASGCGPSDDTPAAPERFGLARTVAEIDLVRKAIEAANAVLAADAESSVITLDTGTIPGPREIPVLILSATNLSKSDVIWVPPRCRCVYIQAPAIRRWLDRVRAAHGYGDPFDEKYLLSFMLLHELGHIARGVDGAYLGGEGSAVNMEGNDAKATETAADAFALAALQRKLHGGGMHAQTAQEIVNNIKIASNNIYFANTLSQSLAEILCLNPSLYWDMGYSHPNLVFRLMKTVDILAPSTETTKIISTYAECRNKTPDYFDKLN